MDDELLIILVGAAIIGLLAVAAIMSIQGREEAATTAESPFAASSEGMTVCRNCGRANLSTDGACIYCGTALPHSLFEGEARIR
jgi:hypothetical protein